MLVTTQISLKNILAERTIVYALRKISELTENLHLKNIITEKVEDLTAEVLNSSEDAKIVHGSIQQEVVYQLCGFKVFKGFK